MGVSRINVCTLFQFYTRTNTQIKRRGRFLRDSIRLLKLNWSCLKLILLKEMSAGCDNGKSNSNPYLAFLLIKFIYTGNKWKLRKSKRMKNVDCSDLERFGHSYRISGWFEVPWVLESRYSPPWLPELPAARGARNCFITRPQMTKFNEIRARRLSRHKWPSLWCHSGPRPRGRVI